MKTNMRVPRCRTHEGGVAKHINAEQALRRSVMACLLFEREFYEDGVDIADRIAQLVPAVAPEKVAALAVEARSEMNLRHAPLLLVRAMAALPTHRHVVADTLTKVIHRADELAEFVAMYWSGNRQPLSSQVKKGLAAAFTRFDAYQLAKYNRDGAVKLRDVLFLCHAKPKDDEQAKVWRQLVDGTLPAPDTWEVALSAGGDKLEHWTRLLVNKRLGALALLRNLRNMNEAGVSTVPIREALREAKVDRVLPFRFIAAARHAPQFEPDLEEAMFRSMAGNERLPGRTAVVVDVSGSMGFGGRGVEQRARTWGGGIQAVTSGAFGMGAPLSSRSDMERIDAACGVAMVAREICDQCRVFSFSNEVVEVAPRRGFALADAILVSQPRGGTYLGQAVRQIDAMGFDRIIVITDEQSHDPVPDPSCGRAYMINVASHRNGVGYGSWTHIDGFSEAVIRYIAELEMSQ